jgi:hypothetical protein
LPAKLKVNGFAHRFGLSFEGVDGDDTPAGSFFFGWKRLGRGV